MDAIFSSKFCTEPGSICLTCAGPHGRQCRMQWVSACLGGCPRGSTSARLYWCKTVPTTLSIYMAEAIAARSKTNRDDWRCSKSTDCRNLTSPATRSQDLHLPILCRWRSWSPSRSPAQPRQPLTTIFKEHSTLADSTLHLLTSGFVAWRVDTFTLPSPFGLDNQT